MAVIEIAKLDTVVEQHAITQPIETIRKDDLALGALRRTFKVDR